MCLQGGQERSLSRDCFTMNMFLLVRIVKRKETSAAVASCVVLSVAAISFALLL